MKKSNQLAKKKILCRKIIILSDPKPRYTENENDDLRKLVNPKLRKELSQRFGRKFALRSQFCRILKEKGISNTDYYKIMRAKYQSQTPKEILASDEDQLILEILPNTR